MDNMLFAVAHAAVSVVDVMKQAKVVQRPDRVLPWSDQ